MWFCFCFLAAYVKLWDLTLRVWVLVFVSCFGMELEFETGKNGICWNLDEFVVLLWLGGVFGIWMFVVLL